MEVKELFQAAIDKSSEQRITDARKNLGIVLNYLTTQQEEGYGATATVALISTFVAADGRISAAEFQFVQDILEGGIDYETFYHAVQAAVDADMFRRMDEIIDHSPKDIKKAFLGLCLDFIACDGNVTSDELGLFAKYAQ